MTGQSNLIPVNLKSAHRPFLKERRPGQETRGEAFRFQQTADLIETKIRGLNPGEALPSTTAWRLKLGVSRTTITRAFAELKARGLLTARAGVGSKVDHPSRTRVVLVVWEGRLGQGSHGALAGEFLTGAAMAAAKHREILVTHLPTAQWGADFRPRHVFPGLAGVIFFRCPNLRDRLAPTLQSEEIPFLLYGSSAYADPHRDVAVDESHLATLALGALQKPGRRRLGFVFRQGHPAGEARRQAWVDWHFAHGLPVHPQRLLAMAPGDSKTPSSALKKWLGGLDGVWAATDSLAVQVHEAAHRFGISVPRDLALVGVDNQGLLGDLDPGLSSIDIPLALHAAKCLEVLLGGQKGLLLRDMQLILRGSLPPFPGDKKKSKTPLTR